IDGPLLGRATVAGDARIARPTPGTSTNTEVRCRPGQPRTRVAIAAGRAKALRGAPMGYIARRHSAPSATRGCSGRHGPTQGEAVRTTGGARDGATAKAAAWTTPLRSAIRSSRLASDQRTK